VGLVLLVAVSLPFLGDVMGVRHRALASFSDVQAAPLRITSPADSAVIGDGNLILIEGTALDPASGSGGTVEVSIDGAWWVTADQDTRDATQWRYLWTDPSSGFHRIRARSLGSQGQLITEQSIIVQVDDSCSTLYTIDNPYDTPGAYRKGELHVHTTSSFDGWNSLPPAQDALAYKRKGYQFIVTSDHDVVSDASEVNDETFVAITGFESTSNAGHITGLFTSKSLSPDLPTQDRIDGILTSGGLAILAHPDWQVGWNESDLKSLHGYLGIEVFNGIATASAERQAYNTQLWQTALNVKGWSNRMWAVAVDDSHDPTAMDRGWVMVKTAHLKEQSLKRAMENGAFYASNGPSFNTLGVLKGAITASSQDAAIIRFIDQDGRIVSEGAGSWAGYKPTGSERWIRVEAITNDGSTAWSQPFWIMPNAPKVAFTTVWGGGMALAGQTIPGARVHISDYGEYLGSVVANDRGEFTFRSPRLTNRPHDFWVMATAQWPDRLDGPPAILTYRP